MKLIKDFAELFKEETFYIGMDDNLENIRIVQYSDGQLWEVKDGKWVGFSATIKEMQKLDFEKINE